MRPMSKLPRSCGKHAALSDNPGARVTQCPCGTVHVLLKNAGVTVQFDEERFQQLGLAVMGAVSALGTKAQAAGTSESDDRTIN
jgi:hypothetical protein